MEPMELALACDRAAFERVRQTLRCGMTEQELFGEVQQAFQAQAGKPVPCQYDLVSGPRAGAIGGPATEKVIKQGECVIADLLPQVDGTWCDTTRTFFLGEPGEELRRAYAALLVALRRGEACLQPGVTGDAVFLAVDQCLREQGYPGLAHHAGHAVGPAPLVEPDFVAGCQTPIQEGMVVTLEPGLYFENNGMRIENNYRITAQGAENILCYPEEIEYFIIQEDAL